jgi:MSHA biogenesis protein MshP
MNLFRARSRQRGAAMMFAIAILVIASLLGAGIAKLVRLEQLGVAREVISTRALLAADSGAQRALAQLFGGTACAANMADYDFSSIDGLNDCSAHIDCTLYDPGGASASMYRVVARGRCSNADPAARRVEVLALAPGP